MCARGGDARRDDGLGDGIGEGAGLNARNRPRQIAALLSSHFTSMAFSTIIVRAGYAENRLNYECPDKHPYSRPRGTQFHFSGTHSLQSTFRRRPSRAGSSCPLIATRRVWRTLVLALRATRFHDLTAAVLNETAAFLRTAMAQGIPHCRPFPYSSNMRSIHNYRVRTCLLVSGTCRHPGSWCLSYR